VFSQKFKGHIEQKNDAIALCNGSWILSLDADERATPELMNSIESILINPNTVKGFKISRLTFHMGRFIYHSGWYPPFPSISIKSCGFSPTHFANPFLKNLYR
jgi:hypothetical protein